jgi:hypothetical protein
VPNRREFDVGQLQELLLGDWIDLGLERSCFDCGVPALNEFLHKYAQQQSKKGVSTVYVLVDRRDPAHILGFYSLSAAQVEATRLSAAAQKKLPRYPIPCFRMGRLAYALLVDAKDEQAARFYEHYGFTALQDAPLTLYLPLGV